METLTCTDAEERLSWETEISPALEYHLKACTHCQRVQQELSQLDEVLSDSKKIKLPIYFADHLMTRIHQFNRQRDWAYLLIESYWAKLGLAGLGAFLSIASAS